MTPQFVIVGTGRSGSAYISQVLTEAGIKTGGESWWTQHGIARDETLIGDSSCCALPLGLDDYEGLIFHQVRHPLDVIQSMQSTQVTNPHLELFQRLIPRVDPSDVLGFAMAYWLASAKAADGYGAAWWRVDQINADLVVGVGRSADITVNREHAQAVIDAVPVTLNEHYSQRMPRRTWAELYDHDAVLTTQIAKCADRYGFSVASWLPL